MPVNVCLTLFGTPSHELEVDGIIRGKHLRVLADELAERLRRSADTLDRLEAAGWTAAIAMYDLTLTRPGVETREQAETALRAAEADPGEFMIVEEVEDEE